MTGRGIVIGGESFICLAGGSTLITLGRQWPRRLGSVITPGFANDVAVELPFAYVADGVNGLVVADVSDPADPVLVGQADTPGEAVGVAVAGGFAYVADGSGGLVVVDARQPAEPAITATVAVGCSRSVGAAGSRVYTGAAYAMAAVDVTNPSAPERVGMLPVGDAEAVLAFGDLAYVADDDGVQVINASNPESQLPWLAFTRTIPPVPSTPGRRTSTPSPTATPTRSSS